MSHTTSNYEESNSLTKDELKKSKKLDDKTTLELIIIETRRQIRQGYHKNAFLQADNYLATTHGNLDLIMKIRLCRHLMHTATKICFNYLYKGDIQRIDHFLHLMDRTNIYLITWHASLTKYIALTQPKYQHIIEGLMSSTNNSFNLDQSIIDDDIYRITQTKEFEMMNNDNNVEKTLKNMSKWKILSKNTQKIMNDINIQKIENFTGQELDVNFSISEYLKYFILHNLNWAIFLKKSKKFTSAFKFFTLCYRATHEIEKSFNPSLIHVCGDARMNLAIFYSELGKDQEALEMYESTLNLFQIEINIRMNRSIKKHHNQAYKYLLTKCIEKIILILINMSTLYELQDNYNRLLETLKSGFWFARAFLNQDSELFKLIERLTQDAIRKYQKYLQDVGELERLVNLNKRLSHQSVQIPNRSNNFITENLKAKFNFEAYNNSQIIFIRPQNNLVSTNSTQKKAATATVTTDEPFLNGLSGGTNDFLDENQLNNSTMNKTSSSPMKEHDHSLSRGKEPDVPISRFSRQSVFNFNRPKTAGNQSKKKSKTKKNSKQCKGEDEPKLLSSDLYFKKIDPQKDIEQIKLSPERELQIIEILNRNIKHNKYNNSNNKEEGYIDIDNYYSQLIEKKINEKAQLMKNPPKHFNEILKRHHYHLNNENFDKKEFKFCQRMLTMKHKEGLQRNKSDVYQSKISTITPMTEANEFINEAEFMQTKTQLENQPGSNTARYPSNDRLRFSRTQNQSIPLRSISTENPNTNATSPKEKITLAKILLKHKNTLELKNVSEILKERTKKHQLGSHDHKTPELAPTPMNNIMENHEDLQKIDEDISKQRRTHSDKAKIMIQTMMENIENQIQKKPKYRRVLSNTARGESNTKIRSFLKDQNDLAKSTHNLSLRTNTSKKIWNFAEVVKISSKLMKSAQNTLSQPTQNPSLIN